VVARILIAICEAVVTAAPVEQNPLHNIPVITLLGLASKVGRFGFAV
jgi:hypothetical protein